VIVDTSVLVAIVRDEPEASAYKELIAEAPIARISASTYLEAGVVVDRAGDPRLSSALDVLLASGGIVVEPFTPGQAAVARYAYQRFGKGSGHPARLNMGDCFSYALARDLGEPLLFKGGDFALTDIEIAATPLGSRRLSEVVASYVAAAP
jgi:ribonuclease VapC